MDDLGLDPCPIKDYLSSLDVSPLFPIFSIKGFLYNWGLGTIENFLFLRLTTAALGIINCMISSFNWVFGEALPRFNLENL